MNTLIALIGCGSIGTEIIKSIKNGEIPHAKVVAIVDTREHAVEEVLGKLNIRDIQNLFRFPRFP